MADIEWISGQNPPIKERLFLICAAHGEPADIQLIGKSEVAIGYWNGHHFRPLTVDHNDLGTKLRVTHWALVGPCLPKGVSLRHQRILDDDVRA